jgi:methanogenic corrinoid protein MtbC1
MAAVTQRTGVGQHTLRAWERRFGVPQPVRLPSGHRRYTPVQVDHLELVVRALALGHRAGDVLPMTAASLRGLLGDAGRGSLGADSWQEDLLRRSIDFDREGILAAVHQAAAHLGVHRFLRERLCPLLSAVGEAWTRGDLAIRHEHFLTELLQDTLRSLRAPLESAAQGRLLLLATLPGERHSLGLQMVALTAAAAGRRLMILGTETPIAEIVAVALELSAQAVALSVSLASANPTTVGVIVRLAAELPPGTALWIGGSGARRLDKMPRATRQFASLEELELELATSAGLVVD